LVVMQHGFGGGRLTWLSLGGGDGERSGLSVLFGSV
jgi:hypothetical protein